MITDNIQSIAFRLDRLEGQLNNPSLSGNQRIQLTKEVDAIYHAIFRDPLPGTITDTEVYQSLCGRALQLHFSLQISSIEERANRLKDLNNSASLAKELLAEVAALTKVYRGSFQELQSLSRSQQAIQEALTKSSQQNHFEFLKEQATRLEFVEDVWYEWYEDLLEIGELVYEGKIREAERKFKNLPDSVKRRVNQSALFQNRTSTLQAFIAAAHSCVGNEMPIPSPEETEEFFREASLL